MAEQKNIRIVQQLLVDLRRGNISGVLDKLVDDVRWRAWGLTEKVPDQETLWGKAQVDELLTELNSAGELQKFEPQEFIAQGEQVMVLGQADQASRKDWVMVFRLCQGKIAYYQYCDDMVVMLG